MSILKKKSILIIGSQSRVISKEILTQSNVISSLQLLSMTNCTLKLIKNSDYIIFFSYIYNYNRTLDFENSVKLAEIITNTYDCNTTKILFLSTDAVFSGIDGLYNLDQVPQPVSVYGKIKFAQESLFNNASILRFTTFGPSFSNRPLLWDLINNNEIKVLYQRSYFSPISTVTLNGVILDFIQDNITVGIKHLATSRISKFELILKISEKLERSFPSNYPINSNQIDDFSLLASENKYFYDVSDEIEKSMAHSARSII